MSWVDSFTGNRLSLHGLLGLFLYLKKFMICQVAFLPSFLHFHVSLNSRALVWGKGSSFEIKGSRISIPLYLSAATFSFCSYIKRHTGSCIKISWWKWMTAPLSWIQFILKLKLKLLVSTINKYLTTCFKLRCSTFPLQQSSNVKAWSSPLLDCFRKSLMYMAGKDRSSVSAF